MNSLHPYIHEEDISFSYLLPPQIYLACILVLRHLPKKFHSYSGIDDLP